MVNFDISNKLMEKLNFLDTIFWSLKYDLGKLDLVESLATKEKSR